MATPPPASPSGRNPEDPEERPPATPEPSPPAGAAGSRPPLPNADEEPPLTLAPEPTPTAPPALPPADGASAAPPGGKSAGPPPLGGGGPAGSPPSLPSADEAPGGRPGSSSTPPPLGGNPPRFGAGPGPHAPIPPGYDAPNGAATGDGPLSMALISHVFRQAVHANMSEPLATERDALALPTLQTEQSRSYAVWRRAVLWCAAVGLGVGALLASVDWLAVVLRSDMEFNQIYGMGNIRLAGEVNPILKFLKSAIFLSIVAAAGLAFTSASNWNRFQLSRSRARLAWLSLFALPLLLALVPWNAFMADIFFNEEQNENARLFVGFSLGMTFISILAPAVIGLMTGAVRSALALKTLVPQSRLPGYLAVGFGPLQGILLIVMLSLFLQMQSGWILILSIGFLIAAPISNFLAAKELIRPHDPSAVEVAIGRVRDRTAILSAIGIGLLGLHFLVAVEGVGFFDALRVIVTAFASALLMTVVMADVLLGWITSNWRDSRGFEDSELAVQLDAQCEDIRSSGLA